MSVLRIVQLCIALVFLTGGVCTHAADKSRYEKHVIKFPTGEREFYIYIPATIPKGKKAPAVITFHGFKSDANGMRWLIKSDAMADKHGFILVYPNAIKKSWNVGRGSGTEKSKVDDISYASALVDVIKARFPVDPKRIYAMGFSNGAQMVAAMACRMPGKISAGGMVAHTMNIQPCEPSHRLPMALIHGAKDPFARFSGGGVNNIASWKDSVDFFRRVHELEGEGKVLLEKPTARCRGWNPKDKPASVIGCVAFDGGHNWPGGVEFQVENFGKVNRELNATKFLFDFFDKHKGKPASRDKAKKLVMNYPAANGTKKKPKKKASRDAKAVAKKKSASGNEQAKAKSKNASSKKAVAAKVNEKAKVAPRPDLKLEWRELGNDKKKFKFAWLKPLVMPRLDKVRLIAVLGPQAASPAKMARLLSAELYAPAVSAVHVFFPFDPWKKPELSASRVQQAMDKVAQELALETPERHLIAWSDGGRIGEELVCESGPDFTTATFVGYGWRRKNCESPVVLPLMLVHSKSDKRHPWKGKKDKGVMSFKALLSLHKERLGGGYERNSIKSGKDHRCDSYIDLQKTTELVACTVDWGGNTIPGVKQAFPKEFGKVMSNLNAVPRVYDFIARHRFHGFTTAHQR